MRQTASRITLLIAPPATVLAAALVMAAAVAAPAAAQDERIVGIWQKDNARSDAPFPGRPDRPQYNAADIEIEISLEGEDVVLVQTSRRGGATPHTFRVHYITNNKPHPAPDLRSGLIQEVRAKWRKKKLTVSYTFKLGQIEADVQDIWEITKKGDLLQTIFGRGPDGTDIRRNYYHRATAAQ